MTPRRRAVRRPRFLAALAATLALVSSAWVAPAVMAATPSADLSASASSLDPGKAGEPFTLTMTLTNVGPDAAERAAARVSLPNGTGSPAVACSAAGGVTCPTFTFAGGTANALVGTMPTGSQLTLTVTGTYPEGAASFSASLRGSSATADPNPASNSATVSTQVDYLATVTATHALDKANFLTGQANGYTLTLKNTSNLDIKGLLVRPYLSAPSQFDVAGTVTCGAGTTPGVCPERFAGAGEPLSSAAEMLPIPLSIDLPAGASLVLRVDFTLTTSLCLGSQGYGVGGDVVAENKASGRSVSFAAPATVSATVRANNCAPPKVAAKATPPASFSIGVPFAVDYSYNNTGSTDLAGWPAIGRLAGEGSLASGGWAFTATTVCAAPGTSTCPSGFPAEGVTRSGAASDDNAFVTPISLPAGARAELRTTYEVKLTACLAPASVRFRSEATGYGKSTVTEQPIDVNLHAAYSNVDLPGCVQPEVDVEQAVERANAGSGTPMVITTTYSNVSDVAVTQWKVNAGVAIPNGSNPSGSTWNASASSRCVEVEGAAPCPSALSGGYSSPVSNNDVGIFPTATAIDLPAHSKLVVRTELTQRVTSCGADGLMNVSPFARGAATADAAAVLAQPLLGTVKAGEPLQITCHNLVTNVDFAPAPPEAGQELTVTATFANAEGRVDGAPLVLELPTDGLIFGGLDDLECSAAGGATCPEFAYDAASRTLSATSGPLGPGSSLKLTLHGRAGVVPVTGESYALRASASATGDTQPDSDTASKAFGFTNERVPLTVTAVVTGDVDQLALPVSFAGTADCTIVGEQPVSLTVAEGATSGSVTLQLWKGDDCTVTLEAPGSMSRAAVGAWGAWTPETVEVENISAASEARFAIAYTVTEASVTPSPSESVTPTPSESVTPTPSESVTPTPSESVTQSPEDTVTPTPSESVTQSPGESGTPTPSESGTPTPSESGTPTPSESGTPTPSESVTPSPEDSATPSSEDTAAPTPEDTVTSGSPAEPGQSDSADASEPGDAGQATQDKDLPATGAPVSGVLAVAVLMLLLGTGVLLVRPRRRGRH